MGKLYCNKCGKKIVVVNEIAHEDYLHVCKSWGYFSKKDGVTQEFIICEECIEKVIEQFVIPCCTLETIEMI